MELDNIVADLNFVSSMIHNIEADCHIKKLKMLPKDDLE